MIINVTTENGKSVLISKYWANRADLAMDQSDQGNGPDKTNFLSIKTVIIFLSSAIKSCMSH